LISKKGQIDENEFMERAEDWRPLEWRAAMAELNFLRGAISTKCLGIDAPRSDVGTNTITPIKSWGKITA
jgi:hypothetical protein